MSNTSLETAHLPRRAGPRNADPLLLHLPPVLRFGRCELHLDKRAVLLDGVRQPVRRKVFDVIVLLISRRPAAVSRDEILDSVWPGETGSPEALARTVLEARRALGEEPDNPRAIVTVRGIGYRFDAAVGDANTPAPGGAEEPLEVVRQLLRRAELGFDLNLDALAAIPHVQQALALAETHGFGVERAKALAWLAMLTMFAGRAETAALQASSALAIARAEQHQGALALALLCDGFVRCMAGDFAGALHALHHAYPLVQDPVPAARRQQCEGLLAMVHRELDNLDEALRWSAKAHDTSLSHGLFLQARRVVGHLAYIKVRCGDALRAQGQDVQALQAWSEGLDFICQLQRNECEVQDPWMTTAISGIQAMLLARMGRVAEARQQFALQEAALSRLPSPTGPMQLQRRAIMHCERAMMNADCNEHSLAWPDVQHALTMLERDEIGHLRTAIYRCASIVLERCGNYREALAWARREGDAALALRKDQAAKLAATMQAESGTQQLRQDIDAARQQMSALNCELQSLRQQVRTLELVMPRDARTGLLRPEDFGRCLMPLHSDARGRELPFCLGLVRLQGSELLQHAHGPEVLNRIFRIVGEKLAAAPQVAPAVARWGDDAVVVALQRLGPRVAADVLRELVQRLENRAWPDELTGLQLRLRAGVIDAAQYLSVDSAADSLYLLHTANRVWPLDAGA